jgi:hypothetical protein
MEHAARLLIVGGLAAALGGIVLLTFSRIGYPRLPGDILIDRGNVKIVFPVATSLALSLVLTIVVNFALRVWR